jgi:MFS family permease
MSGLHALASSFGHLASLRAGVALGEAGLRPAALSIIGDLFPKTRLRLALAVYMLGDSLGFTLGLGAGGYLAGHSG